MASIYCADVYCDKCTEDIKARIVREMQARDGLLGLLDPDELIESLDNIEQAEYDSGEYPKYYEDREESDTPQHCGNHEDCLDPHVCDDGTKVGCFFENDLTTDGDDYVKETVNDDRRSGNDDSVACELWAKFYSYIIFDEACACGDWCELDDNDECESCANKEDELCSGDFTLTPCGALGGKTALGRFEYGNKCFVGEFDSDESAIEEVRRIMQDEQFWPNVWIVSDHGNLALVTDLSAYEG